MARFSQRYVAGLPAAKGLLILSRDKEVRGRQLGDLPGHASPPNLLERAVQRVGDEREPTPVPSQFVQSLWMITQAEG